MPNKQQIKKTKISKKLFVLCCVVVALSVFSVKLWQSTDPSLSLSAWEDVHEWRVSGECADCHSEQEHVKDIVKLGQTSAIPAAKSHTDRFLRFTHGKEENLASHNCSSCHQTKECTACHKKIPESHTQDFVSPIGDSAGMFRHVALGRADITGCYTCHRNFNNECAACHAVDELGAWQNKAEETLGRWREMLDLDLLGEE